MPPQTGSVEWHGHPVGRDSPGTVKGAPGEVITSWESSGHISHAFAKKLRKQAF